MTGNSREVCVVLNSNRGDFCEVEKHPHKCEEFILLSLNVINFGKLYESQSRLKSCANLIHLYYSKVLYRFR